MAQEMKIINPSAEDLNINSEATVEELTLEIQYYFVQMGQNTIEIGKRLTIVKSKLQHGEWQNWLADNFNLKERAAQRFMEISRRFSYTSTSTVLSQSQMMEMLSLPEGAEENFIEEQASKGTPVEKMTIKNLRAAVKKYNDRLKLAEEKVLSFVPIQETPTNEKLSEEEKINNVDEEISPPLTVEPVQNLIEKSVVTEESSPSVTSAENEVAQFLKLIPALLNKGNLQELITKCAVEDVQKFEQQLQQLAVLSEELHKGLENVRRENVVQTQTEPPAPENVIPVEDLVEEKVSTTPASATVEEATTTEKTAEKVEAESTVKAIEKPPEDEESERAAIISELKQIALNDDEKFTKSKQIRKLIEELGADTVNQLKTPELCKILNTVKIDKGGGVQNENFSNRP